MSRTWLSRAARALRMSVAPFLLLITPFVGFVQYQRYGFANPEVLLVTCAIAAIALVLGAGSAMSPAFGVMALAGLASYFADMQADELGLRRLGLLFLVSCVVFWILRRHAHRIVSLMIATVLALSFLTRPSQAVMSQTGAGTSASEKRASLPVILHLLLDEYIGLDGLPAGLTPAAFKQDRLSFFTGRGFRVFGKAYSEYPVTFWAVPHLLNLAPGRYVPDLIVAGPTGGSYRLTRNRYFERLAEMGYSVQVHEPDYLYLCPEGLPASCRTYPTRSLGVLRDLNVPITARATMVAGSFLTGWEAYQRVKDKYRSIRLKLPPRVALPAWNWDLTIPTPAANMPMFDAVAADTSRAQRGTFIFAHILMPHFPYFFDAGCVARPIRDWLLRNDPDRVDVMAGVENVPEGRAVRYALYFEQVACTERRVERLIEAIPAALRDDAIVIVQGDHGSRISLVDPTTVAKASMTPSDYADMFSTMFAVRSPRIEAGYDPRMAPITCLLRTLVESDFRSTSKLAACSSPSTVFFMNDGKPPVPRPLPDFAAAAMQAVVARRAP